MVPLALSGLVNAECLTPWMGAVPCSLLSGPRVEQLHPVSPGPSEGRFLKRSALQIAYLPLNFYTFPLSKDGKCHATGCR